MTVYDVATDGAVPDRLRDLASRSGVSFAVPTFVTMGQIVVGFRRRDYDRRQIEGLLTVEVFVRSGCPRCAAATPFIQGIQPATRRCRWSCTTWRSTRTRRRACRSWRGSPASQPGVPMFHLGGRLVTGWNGLEITGGEVEGLLRSFAGPCTRVQLPAAQPDPPPPADRQTGNGYRDDNLLTPRPSGGA